MHSLKNQNFQAVRMDNDIISIKLISLFNIMEVWWLVTDLSAARRGRVEYPGLHLRW